MSLSTSMPALLDCSLCRRPLSTPKTLKCRHKFCSKCLAKSSSWGGKSGITCPKCGLFTKQEDIRRGQPPPIPDKNKSQRSQSDSVVPNQSTTRNSPEEEYHQCQMCDGGRIVFKCFTCDMFMCVSCKKSHTRIPVTSDHSVRDVKSIANEILENLKEEIAQHKSYSTQVQQRLSLYIRYKTYLNRLENDICSEIDRAAVCAKEKICKIIDEESLKTKKTVTEKIEEERQNIEEGHTKLKTELEQSKRMTSLLTEAVASGDDVQVILNGRLGKGGDAQRLSLSLLDDKLKDKLDIMVIPIDVEEEFQEICIQFCDIDISRGDLKLLNPTPESVRRSNTFETISGKQQGAVSNAMPRRTSLLPMRSSSEKKSTNSKEFDITKREDRVSPLGPDSVHQFVPRCSRALLEYAPKKKWLFKDHISVPNACDMFAVIDGHFWCVSRNTHVITVVKLEGKILRTLAHNNMRYPSAVTQYAQTSAIVACSSGFGLLEFDFGGKLKSVIAKGSFSDVSTEDDAVVALETEPSKIVVYKFCEKSHMWICHDELELDFMTGSDADTAVSCNDQYIVSSVKHKCVFVYDRHGVLLRTHRAFLPGGLGSWHLCRLSMVDEHGTLLIIDQNRNKLLVLNSENETDYLVFEQEPKVLDALLDYQGFLWVLDNKSKLLRYQQEFPLPVSNTSLRKESSTVPELL